MSEGADTVPVPRIDGERCETALELERDEAARLAERPRARQTATRIVVIGEFNSGKTSLVNALVGAPVLPTSFVAHTPCPTIITYAAKPALSGETASRRRVPIAWDRIGIGPQQGIRRLHVGVPLEQLKALRVIDTPGLALGDEVSDAQTLRACRGADKVIWCTPAMQAWKASEQRAWLTLPKGLRQRGILAVTFTDAIASQTDVDRVLARLHAEAGALFRGIVRSSAVAALGPAPHQAPTDPEQHRSRGVRAARTVVSPAMAELR